MLVGEGARLFALDKAWSQSRWTPREAYEKWQREHPEEKPALQIKRPAIMTRFALLVLGADGNIAGGCSTADSVANCPVALAIRQSSEAVCTWITKSAPRAPRV